MPIKKPMGREIDPYLYPNRVKTYQVSGLGYLLSSLAPTVLLGQSRWIVSWRCFQDNEIWMKQPL
jgi:hypothetical protein